MEQKLKPNVFDKILRLSKLFFPITTYINRKDELFFSLEAKESIIKPDGVILVTTFKYGTELMFHDKLTVLKLFSSESRRRNLRYPEKFYPDMVDNFESWVDFMLEAWEEYLVENNPLKETNTPAFTLMQGRGAFLYNVKIGSLNFSGEVVEDPNIAYVYLRNKVGILLTEIAHLDRRATAPSLQS